MKRLLSIIAAIIMIAGFAVAKDKEAVKCTLTLLDGKTISGYMVDYKTKTNSYGADKIITINTVYIANNPGEAGTEYSANDAKKIVFNTGSEDIECLSMYILRNNSRPLNLKHGNEKGFMNVVYKKDGIIGLASNAKEVFFSTTPPVMKIPTYVVSYCVEGDEVAVPYWIPSDANSIGAKTGLRYCFERFPKVAEYIKGKDFKIKDLKDDPLSILNKVVELK